MNRLYLLLVITFFLSASLRAQNSLPPVYEIKIDTGADNHVSPKYWQLLPDPSGKYTINQVSNGPLAGSFRFIDPQKENIKSRFCWFRYRIKNTANHDIKVMIPEYCAEAEIYNLDSASGKWQMKESGELVPWSKRSGLAKALYIMYPIKPGQEILFYERDRYDNQQASLDFVVGYYDDVVKKYYIDENNTVGTAKQHLVSMSVLTGILLLAGVINLIFFGVVKERFYLYFALYALLTAFGVLIQNTDVAFREHPVVIMPVTYFAAALAGVFYIAFARIYLQTKNIAPRTHNALMVIAIAAIIIASTLTFMSNALPLMLGNFLTSSAVLFRAVVDLLLFIVLIKLWVRRIPGRFVKIAVMGPLCFVMVIIMSVFFINLALLFTHITPGLWPFTNWVSTNTNWIMLTGSSWLIIGMSTVLFKRFQDLQNKIVYDTLEHERFEREKEIEHSQLIARQNEELEKQVATRTTELTQSLVNLKQTQTQLIQSEKMASLGELTAGIAHEIQNPLNFVNNFSEVSIELLDELKDEAKAGNSNDVIAIAADLTQNLQKINHHGKRADFIVKGMLQHSRTSTGERQPTNINLLADEFLKLSYHGLRAKDKNFNAELVTNFDGGLPQINIVQQDIGRALLNLFNNAFYAVKEKQKTAGPDYKPEVTLTTFKENNQVVIKVKDNGIGIPDSIKEKIMQPFFTTKPTGEGTGLGLSLSYDIVVKGHGGNIIVNSRPGEGAEFIIQIPLT